MIDISKVNPCIKCGSIERYKDGHCKACARTRAAVYRNANHSKTRASVISWGEANPEKKAAGMASWHAKNRERAHTNHKIWCENNPERWKEIRRVSESLRRSRRNASGGKLSTNIVGNLLKLQRGKCSCCGESIKSKNHLDHIIPLALGGCNTDSNIQLLCPSCNVRKHAKHPIDFMQQRGFLL